MFVDKLRKNLVEKSVNSMRNKLVTLLFILLYFLQFELSLVIGSTLDVYKNARLGHRIIQTRYGRLHGLILPLENFRYLRSVEVFLGVPYATPPTKQNRFSPTRAPTPWDGIRISDKYSPVCPQRLPNIQNETAALEKMPKGRLEYLKRLLPFLENQSEDCLYLNIFSPTNAGASEKKLPVLVFIHGESFEWSSGNPYDGSVLASYGEVVVVTLNYRLGILGFLNANPVPQSHARVANYGLMDQIAALHWVQQNIPKFGGDPNAVTLLGHGTGAACINYLMTSPTMVRGLFQRAILMSGSAYASWALVEDPVYYAIKLAKEVNCSIPEDINKNHEQIVDCLREVPLDDLFATDIQAPNFLASFGPSVDGVVIQPGHSNLDMENALRRNYKRYSGDSASSRSGTNRAAGQSGSDGSNYYNAGNYANLGTGTGHYDILFGVVTGESIWRFSAHDIQNGFEGDRRDKIIRTYVRNAYNYHLNEIFYTIVNEYTDWDRTSQHPINTRDTAVAALSDAQFVAPIIRTGDLLAMQSPPHLLSGSSSVAANIITSAASSTTLTGSQSNRCYFYVFDYQTKDGDYPQRMGTVHGEDLPYIFGAPLVDGFSHFPQNYTKSEVALSEAVIIFWTNFARTGNPNDHHRQESILSASKERNRFRTIMWDNYDSLHQKYLEIGMKPRIKNHYRAHELSVWLRLIPELHRAGMEDVISRHNLFRNHDDPDLYEGMVKPDPFGATRLLATNLSGIISNNLGFGGVSYVNGILGVTSIDPTGGYTTCIPVNGTFTGSIFAPNTLANASTDTISSGYEAAGYAAYSTALSVTIAIGCSLLILNVLIFAGVYYQRDKTRLEVKTLQKQYQQRALHQQSPYPPDTIKHAHFHLGHSQSANVIVDVENSGGNQNALLLTAPPVNDLKAPPPTTGTSTTHMCPNTSLQLMPVSQTNISQQHMQHQQQQQQQQHQLQQQMATPNIVSLGIGAINASPNANNMNLNNTKQQQQMSNVNSLTNGGLKMNMLGNANYSTSPKYHHQQQQQQQQQSQQHSPAQREHILIKSMSNTPQTFNSRVTNGISAGTTTISYNAGMSLPKANTLHHTTAAMNYLRNPSSSARESGTGSSMTAALLDSRGNMLLTTTNVSSGDCLTLPRSLSARTNINAESQQQQQQYHQQLQQQQLQQQQQQQQAISNEHQLNGNILTSSININHSSNRAPRPPMRTASSTSSNVGAKSMIAIGSLIDQTPSNGSSSSGVSSEPSTKGISTGNEGVSGQFSYHHGHTHSHATVDSIDMKTTTSTTIGSNNVISAAHLQQQVPQAAIDEMRV